MKLQKGFTLIELMFVVVIIGVLAAIAYPSYTDSVQRARRQEARDALLRVAAAEEKFNNECGGYTTVLNGTIGGAAGARCSGLGMPGATATTLTTERGFYTITVATPGAAALGAGGGPAAATSFVATAVPAPAQVGDALRCTSLSITNTLAKTATGTDSAGLAGGRCWGG